MIIRTTSYFNKRYLKLPLSLITQAQEKERLFRKDPFHPQLKTHKLKGKEKEAWSFSVNYSYRIKFIFLKEDEVLFIDIGTHAIYE